MRVSVSSDISILRNFKSQQQFWTFGQNVKLDFAPTVKNALYVDMCYFAPGRFHNVLIATAKSPTTVPQQVSFTNHAKVQLKEFAIGWKHFIRGHNESEDNWSVYSVTGFGLIFGKAQNNYSISIDTSLYNAPARPMNGTGHFKRLSIDLGIGVEFPIAYEIYFYSEGRICIPTTEYPSKFLGENNNAPRPAMIGAGLRVLF